MEKRRHRSSTPPEERFWRFADRGPDDECWLWRGGTNGTYGVFGVDNRRSSAVRTYAHRFAYTMMVGAIPSKHEVHHTCGQPLCVNPGHLRPLPRKTHVRIGSGLFASRARQQTCKRGHALEVFADGRRHCRVCARANALARKAHLRALAESDPSVVPHGTTNGYFNYQCRCEACTAAMREDSRRRRRTAL